MANNTIGQFISALRKANGLTQQNVADRLNVSNKAVSRWERDECAPDLSLIPAIAEMFGVTCDELLKGERIANPTAPERKEPKVDRQVKALLNRSLSSFKTLIWISLAVAVVGLVCMLGISYGFYRPVIGFAVMMLFEVGATVLSVIAVNKMRDVKSDNEIFDMADQSQRDKFHKTFGSLSFISFFVILAVLLLSLPLILGSLGSGFVYSVMSFDSYLIFFMGVALLLVLIWLKGNAPFIAWIVGEAVDVEQDTRFTPTESRRKMNLFQIGFTLFAGIVFLIAPYFDIHLYDANLPYIVLNLMGLLCLLANIVCFAVFLIKEKENRKSLVLPGIRNMLFIPSAFMFSMVHIISWIRTEGGTSQRYESWATGYLAYALGLGAVIFIVFTIIETVVKKNRK